MTFGGSACGVLAAALMAIGLAACSAPPYPTAVPKAVQRDLKRQADQAGRADQVGRADQADQAADRPAGPYAISLCYSKMFNTQQDLMEEARLICRNGTPTYYDSDTIWTPCSLHQPLRATFICTPSPQ